MPSLSGWLFRSRHRLPTTLSGHSPASSSVDVIRNQSVTNNEKNVRLSLQTKKSLSCTRRRWQSKNGHPLPPPGQFNSSLLGSICKRNRYRTRRHDRPFMVIFDEPGNIGGRREREHLWVFVIGSFFERESSSFPRPLSLF